MVIENGSVLFSFAPLIELTFLLENGNGLSLVLVSESRQSIPSCVCLRYKARSCGATTLDTCLFLQRVPWPLVSQVCGHSHSRYQRQGTRSGNVWKHVCGALPKTSLHLMWPLSQWLILPVMQKVCLGKWLNSSRVTEEVCDLFRRQHQTWLLAL